MRKCLPKLLLPIIGMLIGTNAHTVTASSYNDYDFEVDGLYYRLVESDYVVVSYKSYMIIASTGAGIPDKHIYYTDYSGDIIIPESINVDGIIYPVKEISHHAFSNCSELTSVTIPNSVTYIGENAFKGCTGLMSMMIPISVTNIDDNVFNGCSNMRTICFNAENCSDFSTSPFRDCLIENFVFGDNVKRIPASLLYYCNTLTSVTIPNSVTSIGDSAFDGCSGLSSVTIPSSVTSIGVYVFGGCTGLYNADVKEIKQASAKINVKCNILGVKYGVTYNYSFFEADENGDVNINGLRPNYKNYCGIVIKLRNGCISNWAEYEVKTKGFSPYVGVNGITPTTAKLKGSYKEIDAKVTGVEFSCGGVANIEGNTAYITGLNPDTKYTVNYTVKSDNNYTETTTCTFTTPKLTMTTLAAEATSNTVAVIAAETNLSDEETGAGFEWRRYDAPDLVPSSKAPCPVVDGKLMGALNNLSASTYYKYRPYYTSASGQTYYSAWLAFGTADAYVYFEPLVRTYAATNVTSGGASVKAYVVAGSDAITSQGFEYWLSNNTMNRMRAEAAPSTGVQTIEASGQWMNATLEGLKESSEYTYRAYVTTAKGTTYGEEQSFTTEKGAGINGIIADEKSEVVEVARYTIDGRMIDEPQRGVNIVRYSDGSVRKVLVK